MASSEQSRESDAGTSSNAADDTRSNQLLYKFDAGKPWQYFTKGPPIGSSVERGKRKKREKLQKMYVPRKRKIIRRKNASFKDLNQVPLTCCESGCLLRGGAWHMKGIIRKQRNMLITKTYNEQNYVLSKLLKVELSLRGRRQIKYQIPTVGTVCKTAFKKCFGLSNSKIRVLLRKMSPEGPSIEPDKRGQKVPRKLLPDARNAVIGFFQSQDASESHYCKSRTNKRYFDSNVSMRQMWLEFTSKNPDLKTSLKRKNRGQVISYSAFRSLFNKELSDLLSFRKARQDTCQVCDQINNRLAKLIAARKKSRKNAHSYDDEICELKAQRLSHQRESEVRFASLKYDVNILSSKV